MSRHSIRLLMWGYRRTLDAALASTSPTVGDFNGTLLARPGGQL